MSEFLDNLEVHEHFESEYGVVHAKQKHDLEPERKIGPAHYALSSVVKLYTHYEEHMDEDVFMEDFVDQYDLHLGIYVPDRLGGRLFGVRYVRETERVYTPAYTESIGFGGCQTPIVYKQFHRRETFVPAARHRESYIEQLINTNRAVDTIEQIGNRLG